MKNTPSMPAEISTHNDHGKDLLKCLIFTINEIDEIKSFNFFVNILFDMIWVLPYEMLKFVTAFCFVWNCSENPFLEVCKLTDLMAIKVGRFTDLVAVLVEYYWGKSNKGFNMQGLTHILEKSKLLIRTYKVEGFTDLVAVFESHCWLCTCREHTEKWARAFAEAMQFIVPTYWFCFTS